MSKARQRYSTHRSSALKRNVKFELTFEEWYYWWLSNGVDKNYPTTSGPERPCMCRYNDTGAYSLANIYYGTISSNMADNHKINPRHLEKNGNAKAIMTPLGKFNTCTEAARAMNTSRKNLWSLCKKDSSNYYMI